MSIGSVLPAGGVRPAVRRDRDADLDNLTSKSKVIFIRDIRERVQDAGAVPDARPRPVSGDARRPDQVRDRRLHLDVVELPVRRAARRLRSGTAGSGTFNYIRNSVKAVVDAYDGTVTMYLSDTLYGGKKDPIIRAYAKAFPGLFEPRHPRDAQPPTSATRSCCSRPRPRCGAATTSPNPSTFFNNSDRGTSPSSRPNTTTGDDGRRPADRRPRSVWPGSSRTTS